MTLPLNAIEQNFNGSLGSQEIQGFCHYAIHAIEITICCICTNLKRRKHENVVILMALMAIWHFLSKINGFQTAIEKNVNGSVWQEWQEPLI